MTTWSGSSMVLRGASAHQIAAASAATSASGVTSTPIFRKRQAVTSIFSRRSATSHRIVASDPVTERLGPRSTPISIALMTGGGRWPLTATEPATRPTGRLLAMLSAIEATIPAPQAAWVGDFSIPACRSALRWPIVPVFTNVSTITNNPATNGNTLQEMPFTTGQGDWRLRASTAAAVTSPQMKVGNPQMHVKCRGRQQHHADRGDTDCGELAAAAELGMRHAALDALFSERVARSQAKHDIGHDNRCNRGQRELAQPFEQMGHALAEYHEIGGIGDWQNKACRVGDEGAGKQIGQGTRTGGAGRGIDRGRQHNRSGVIGQQHGD